MPAIANLVIPDGQATPVNHTFEPAKATSDYVLWEDRDAGIFIGNKKLSLALTRPQGNGNVGNRNLKLHLKLELPRLQTVSNSTVTGIPPAPTVAYRLVAELICTLPERSTQAERKDLRLLLVNALREAVSGTQVSDAIDKLALPY